MPLIEAASSSPITIVPQQGASKALLIKSNGGDIESGSGIISGRINYGHNQHLPSAAWVPTASVQRSYSDLKKRRRSLAHRGVCPDHGKPRPRLGGTTHRRVMPLAPGLWTCSKQAQSMPPDGTAVVPQKYEMQRVLRGQTLTSRDEKREYGRQVAQIRWGRRVWYPPYGARSAEHTPRWWASERGRFLRPL